MDKKNKKLIKKSIKINILPLLISRSDEKKTINEKFVTDIKIKFNVEENFLNKCNSKKKNSIKKKTIEIHLLSKRY